MENDPVLDDLSWRDVALWLSESDDAQSSLFLSWTTQVTFLEILFERQLFRWGEITLEKRGIFENRIRGKIQA